MAIKTCEKHGHGPRSTVVAINIHEIQENTLKIGHIPRVTFQSNDHKARI